MTKKQNIIFNVIVIGAGGTGTYFIKEAGRFISSLKNKHAINTFTIVDADIVEEKNLSRQSFMPEDIGEYKADVMANALYELFGIDATAVTRFIDTVKDLKAIIPNDSGVIDVAIPVIIGCVDNHACRLVCERFFESSANCIYYDSANEFDNGEVVYAVRLNGKTLAPARSFYFPEIKQKRSKKRSSMSCTELNAVAPQHILTNMCAGMALLAGFMPLIENYQIKRGICMFNPFLNQMQFMPFEEKNEEVSKDECIREKVD